ncbi:hypothetical protein [Modestobacter sp. NPDC049651]|uniref:hypothetical protein n=1 Tax=unclassified Modestobacter TaxID=2643866 RepID=UPI0033C14311
MTTPTPGSAAAREAVRDRVAPPVGAMRIVGALGAPAELLVPVIWSLTGRRGAPLAPTAVATANAVVAAVAVPVLRRRPGTRIRRAVALPVLAWLVAGPALAGRSRRLVLLPGRNPLWALLLQLVPRLVTGVLQAAAVLVVGRRARAAAEASDADR